MTNNTQFNTQELFILLAAAIATIGIAAILTEIIAKETLELLQKINYELISKITLIFLVAITWLAAGPMGIVACATATGISIYANASNVKKSHCMNFLLVPTMLFYLGINI